MSEQDLGFEKFKEDLLLQTKRLGFTEVAVGIPIADNILSSALDLHQNVLNRKELSPEDILQFIRYFCPDFIGFLNQELQGEFKIVKRDDYYYSIDKKEEYTNSGIIEYTPDFGRFRIGLIYARWKGEHHFSPSLLGGPAQPERAQQILENYASSRFGPLKESKDFVYKGWKRRTLR